MHFSGRSYGLAALLTAAALLVCIPSGRDIARIPFRPLRCQISLENMPEEALHRLVLNRFFDTEGLPADFSEAPGGVDSLLAGICDVAVVHAADSLPPGLLQTAVFPDSAVWTVREADIALLREMNVWMGTMGRSGHFLQLRQDFLRGRRQNLGGLSDYDSLIRSGARSAGMDWRLLASVVFHESRFSNEASSAKGAVGLMQIRSGKYSVDTLLDPAVNIAIGTQYLCRLERMFSPFAADSTEALKLALAAFNAGEGKVMKALAQAGEDSLATARWADVAPYTKPATRRYVDKVLNTYTEYRLLYGE